MLVFRVQKEDQEFMQGLLQGFSGSTAVAQEDLVGDGPKEWLLPLGPSAISSLASIFSALITHFKGKKDPSFEVEFRFADGHVEGILREFNIVHMDDLDKAVEYIAHKVKELNMQDDNISST